MTTRPSTTPASTQFAFAKVPGIQTSSSYDVRPASASATSRPTSRKSSRPFSSSNLSTSVANARFKSFQVQYEILCRNPILVAIAQEIPWKNLFDLFLLKFYAVNDKLWSQGEHPHELAFVLCGGFLTRNLEEESAGSGDDNDKPKVRILAEKMVKPGGSLAAFAVLKGTPLPYAIVTTRFKSILLSLPSQRLKSVMRQLKPATQEIVEQLIYEAEQKLMESLALPFRVRRDPRISTAPAGKMRSGLQSQSVGRLKKHAPVSLVDRLMGSSEKREKPSAMKRSASASAVGDGAPSWASLHVAKPMEYEVNSSLLILHQSSSTGKLHQPAPTAKSAILRSSNLSTVASLIAKKHTQRRLQSIKLPIQADAFPSQRLSCHRQFLEKGGEGHSLGMTEESLGRQTRKRVIPEVVPKERVGRLLKPLKKPVMIPNTLPGNSKASNEETQGSSMGSRRGRRVLVANRSEHFRDASTADMMNY